eukprot:CAMPEP_0177647462 /NCGR_PEP_ID=MMETSP0447-20121125/10311_1 /TAXON_ID=0 /ORGANISM="Stygamoeba regulata, Strain BSH-02190019" /LENGTH=115 /DNA_ID=CAMNT_0019150045 /DNA_START=312 /DNA_END=659 /DNA_ORIENTATION=+
MSDNENDNEGQACDIQASELHFRNYRPRYMPFRALVLPPPSYPTAESKLAELKSAIKKLDLDNENTPLNLAPKKVNWDLKRDISDKIDLLDRRTQRSIVAILQSKAKDEDEDSDA